MRRSFIIAVLLGGCLLAGLSAAPLMAAGKVQVEIAGTGDSQELLRQLGKLFMARNPGIEVVIPDSIGSSGGIRAVLLGKQVMARTARPLLDNEKASGLVSRTFAVTPVVFAVNPSVTGVAAITADEAVALFAGQIRDWSQVGGPKRKVYLVNREPGDSSLMAITRQIPAFAAAATSRDNTFYSTPEAMKALVKYSDTIGYGPLSMVHGSVLKPLTVDGVAPTVENVRSGKYPLKVELQLVWKEPLAAPYREFLAFIDSSEGSKAINAGGAVAVGR